MIVEKGNLSSGADTWQGSGYSRSKGRSSRQRFGVRPPSQYTRRRPTTQHIPPKVVIHLLLNTNTKGNEFVSLSRPVCRDCFSSRRKFFQFPLLSSFGVHFDRASGPSNSKACCISRGWRHRPPRGFSPEDFCENQKLTVARMNAESYRTDPLVTCASRSRPAAPKEPDVKTLKTFQNTLVRELKDESIPKTRNCKCPEGALKPT